MNSLNELFWKFPKFIWDFEVFLIVKFENIYYLRHQKNVKI